MSPSLALVADVLVHATPLIVAGLAVAIAFRAGLWNIGADGQLLVGAAVAAWVGISVPPTAGAWAVMVALVGGAIGGMAWAWIAAELRARFGVLEVISTIMLNFIAVQGIAYLVRGPLQEPTHIYPQTTTIAAGTQLPVLVTATRLHAGFVLAVLLAIATWWFMTRTEAGFRIRSTGANPFAARVTGRVDTRRTTTRTFLASGAFAGLAGAIEVCGVTYALYENLSPGYGYTAIAVALLAGLHPLGVIATGVLFGILETGAGVLQRDAAIPSTLASVIEATIVLVVIAIGAIRTRRLQTR